MAHGWSKSDVKRVLSRLSCSGGAMTFCLGTVAPLLPFLPFLLSLPVPSHPMSCPVPPIPSVTFSFPSSIPSLSLLQSSHPLRSSHPSSSLCLSFPIPSPSPPCREAAPLNSAIGGMGCNLPQRGLGWIEPQSKSNLVHFSLKI